jgi:hypothetical protein
MAFLAMKAGLTLTNIPGVTRESVTFYDIWGIRQWYISNFDDVISSHYIPSDLLITVWTMQDKRGNV